MEFCGCCCKKKSTKWRMAFMLGTALFLLVFGGIFMVMYYAIFSAVVEQQTEIREGTIVYPNWVEPNGDIVYAGFYFLNITNAEEFASQSPDKFVKPVLEEKGPYVYKAIIVKDNIHPLGTTPKQIEYRQTFNFYYEPEKTVGSENDIITTINYVALALGQSMDWVFSQPGAEGITQIQRLAAYTAMNQAVRATNTTILLKSTVRELLFGMQDPLVTAIVDTLNTVLAETGLSHLVPLPDTFSLFGRLNDSRGWHTYRSYIGDPDSSLTNKIVTVDGESELNHWFGDACNVINGSDGTLRPPMGKKDELIYHFYPSACRATYVKYVKDTIVKRVPAWEYRPPPEMFKAPTNSTYNECEKNSAELYCQYDGAQFLGECYYGAPMMLSAPHFLHGDERYLSKLVGLSPNLQEHGTVFTYEPNTGAALSVEKKLQFNLYLKPHDHIEISQKIGETFAFPIMWVNGTYMVTDANANLIWGFMVVAEIVMYCVQAVILVTGACLIGYVVWYYFSIYRTAGRKALVDEDELPGKQSMGPGVHTKTKSTML